MWNEYVLVLQRVISTPSFFTEAAKFESHQRYYNIRPRLLIGPHSEASAWGKKENGKYDCTMELSLSGVHLKRSSDGCNNLRGTFYKNNVENKYMKAVK